MLNFNPNRRDPGAAIREQFGQGLNSLDGIFEAYQRAKMQGQGIAQQRGLGIAERGFDASRLTPEIAARERAYADPSFTGPAPAEAVPGFRSWLTKQREGAALKTRETEAGIEADLALAESRRRVQTPRQGVPARGGSSVSSGRILPASSVLALNEGKAVARILPEVEQAIQGNTGIFGPAEGRVRGANPYDTQSQTVDARMRTASQAFGRFMEGGVLRKEDEEKYRKMFPQLSDTPDLAKNKLSIVRRQLAQKYGDDRNALGGSGYDVSGFGELEIPASIFDTQAPAGGKPKVGEVRKGYRFKGGNPADKASWEPS